MTTDIWYPGPPVGSTVRPLTGQFIVSGAVTLDIEFLNKETYAAVLIRRNTERLNKGLK
ncbi:hypothetical protein N7490_010890 [Penicillium lividum]|nr:hypothetical protein N7490_010890 [Penicillium lividum]